MNAGTPDGGLARGEDLAPALCFVHRWTTGHVRVRVTPSTAWILETTIFPSESTSSAAIRAITSYGPVTATAVLEFGWAAFGVGIPFTNTGMVPYTRTVEAGPAVTATVSVTWTPASSGPQCVFVRLSDPLDNYEDLLIQRNVQVDERPACGKTETFTL